MIKATVRWFYQIAFWGVVAGGLIFSAAVFSLRYWILPNLGQYRQAIASSISKEARQPVSIGALSADWQGLRPHVSVSEIFIHDRQGRPGLNLSNVEATLSWWSLLLGEIRLKSLVIDRPDLAIRRDTQGVIHVAGIPVTESAGDSGLADWVLKQGRILIRDARITWVDESRQAPPLILDRLNLRLDNFFGRHHFGLSATPPQGLASPLDLRGDFKGASLSRLDQWEGTLFFQMDRADLASWQTWLPRLPALDLAGRDGFELRQGFGGLRAWLEFHRNGVADVTADLRLSDVKTRLAKGLPELDLQSLSGRLGWKGLPGGFEVSGRKLMLARAGAAAIQPVDLRLRLQSAHGGQPLKGEFDASQLVVDQLVALADFLPLDSGSRKRLAELSPRGTFHELHLSWAGDWEKLLAYSAKGRFEGVSLKPFHKLPGFSNISGNLDGSEGGGALFLNTTQAALDMPSVFREPLLLDNLTAQVSWKMTRDHEVEVRLSNIAIANAHVAGSLHGTYLTRAGTPGDIDLTGQFSRADARHVGKYIPLVVGKDARDWLDTAFLAGHSNDVSLRLKGNLADYPFADGKKGVFQVAAKVSGGVLDYARGWPRIDNLAVDLLFQGARMEVNASQGNMLGHRLVKVKAVIPDLLAPEEMLQIEGETQGPTQDALRYIEQSPVSAMIDDFTRGIEASGNGRLQLKLDIPLRRSHESKVAGTYHFQNNRVVVDAGTPALDQVNGRLEFTESGVRVQNLAASVMGGPATINASSQRDTVRVAAQGRLNIASLRKQQDHPLLAHLKGTADWRGNISIRKKQADFVFESNLVGLGSELPQPLDKNAADALFLRLEKKMAGEGQDTVTIQLGRNLAARLARRADERGMRVERGVIGLGGASLSLPPKGLWINGALPELDLDAWRNVLAAVKEGPPLNLGGMDLRLGSMDMLGRRFHDVALSGRGQGALLQLGLAAREFKGEASWDPAGRGRITARLEHLRLPDAAPAQPGASSPTTERPAELPALDVVVKSLELKQKKLGQFELLAAPQGADWKIERLRIANPDFSLQADGTWAAWQRQPRTQIRVKLEAGDVGKTLSRLGYPNMVSRGAAKVDGQLNWMGSPQDMDLRSLEGSLNLSAENGQFLKVEPGIGKLLGVLSLQALPRRITLDFRDVFSEGFAFEQISATARISRGVLTSSDFVMEGPTAKVFMNGETDLNSETQRLRVNIQPQLGSSVSGAVALVNPAAGVATWVLQKMLQNPIDQIAAFEYNVTGTWADPVVTKVERPALRKSEE